MIKFRPLLFIAILVCSNFALAKENVSLQEFTPEMREEVIKRFPSLEKEGLSREQIDDLIRFVQIRFQFDQVRVIKDGPGPLKIRYERTARVSEVRFEGLSGLTESEARGYFAMKSGDLLDQDLIVENGEALRQAYRNIGYLNAVIDIELPTDPKSGSTAVVVKVSENKRTRVGEVVFQSPNQTLNKFLTEKLNSFVSSFSFARWGFRSQALTENNLVEIRKKIRELLNKERYFLADATGPDIEFSADESIAKLSFRLDRVDQYNLIFEGNKHETNSSINDALALDSFYTASPNIGPELANRVRNFYLSRGYARVEVVTVELEGRNQFEKRILININEGSKIKIQKIAFNGRFSRDSSYYENFLRKNSSAIISKGYYNKDDLETGYKNLLLELQNEGYLVAKIISTRSQYNKDKNQMTLVVNLDEGPLTEIEGVGFVDNKSFSNEELLAATGLKSSGPLKLNQIEAAVNNIKNFYRERGYIEMQLLNEREDLVTYNADNTRAQLNFKIYEGPQVRAATIVIEGNHFTRDSVILREIDLEVNEIVTPGKIEESTARLQRTGFFGSVEISTVEAKTNVSDRTVLIKVTERDPGVFTVGAGATNERGFTVRGYTGIGYRNLWGTGRGVSARLEGNYNISDIKYLESRITFGYLEPYLFNTRVRGRINLTRSKEVVDYDLREVREINQVTYSVEKDFSSHVLGVYQVYGLATIKETGVDDSYKLPTTVVDIATTGPALDIDYRDNPFNPTRGTFTKLSAEYSMPRMGSSRTISYWTSNASFTHYWRLTENPLVWANSIRGGYIKNLSSEPDGGVPYDLKGYILGGRSTIRGYEAGTSEVFPNRQDLGSDKFLLTTSARMLLLKSEIRFPIYGNIAGAVFYDGGSVTIEGLDLKDNYRDSAGVGLRYNTPVGPVNLEVGWKLDRREGEEPARFHLSIGTF